MLRILSRALCEAQAARSVALSACQQQQQKKGLGAWSTSVPASCRLQIHSSAGALAVEGKDSEQTSGKDGKPEKPEHVHSHFPEVARNRCGRCTHACAGCLVLTKS